MPLFSRQKLFFKIADGAGDITLTEATRYKAGMVHMNFTGEGVYLWTPNSKEIPASEAVCDFRFLGLDKGIADRFTEATKGLFLPARMCVFHGHNPDKMQRALEWFDFVIVPDKRIKNTQEDLHNRHILSYTAGKHTQPVGLSV